MARETVTIVDKTLRLAYKRMRHELQGKRRNPVISKFKARKVKLLDDPWLFKGIDEEGRHGTWRPNTPNTMRKKMQYQRKQFGGDVVSNWENRKKHFTMDERTKWLMVHTGTLRENVRFGHSPKKSQFFLSAPGTGKYSYMHLQGAAGKYPARPWGVWTVKDQMYLVKLLEKWAVNFGSALRRAA